MLSEIFSLMYPNRVLLEHQIREIVEALEIRLAENREQWEEADRRRELGKIMMRSAKRGWGWDLCDFGEMSGNEVGLETLPNGEMRNRRKARQLGLYFGCEWTKDIKSEEWKSAREIAELVFMGSWEEVLGCSRRGSDAGCRDESASVPPHPNMDNSNSKEEESQDTYAQN